MLFLGHPKTEHAPCMFLKGVGLVVSDGAQKINELEPVVWSLLIKKK